jgi:hypothetical protein
MINILVGILREVQTYVHNVHTYVLSWKRGSAIRLKLLVPHLMVMTLKSEG